MGRSMAMVMLLFKPSSAVRAGPLLRTSSRMLASPRRSARPVAVATEAAVPVFDERLVSEDPELVKSSLLRRKAGDALLASVDRIGELTGERASVISEGNTARMEKKTLSQKIGGHMKAGEQDEAAALKVEVAKLNEVARASNPAPDPAPDPAPNPEPEPEPNPNAEPAPEPEQVADASDAKVDELEAQRSSLFNSLPNLLDPRTPEGVDEDSNVEVSKRGGGGGGSTSSRRPNPNPNPDPDPDPGPDPDPDLDASYTHPQSATHGPAAPHAIAPPHPNTHLRTRLASASAFASASAGEQVGLRG